MEHPDLGEAAARIIADGDGLADVAGERRAGVAQALEVDAASAPDRRGGVQVGIPICRGLADER